MNKPRNFVAEVNGHEIYRNDEGRFDLYTTGVGWWGFDFTTEADARRACEAVNAPKGDS